MPKADFFSLRGDNAEDEQILIGIYVLVCKEKTRHSPGKSSPRAVKERVSKWRKKHNGDKSEIVNFKIEIVVK